MAPTHGVAREKIGLGRVTLLASILQSIDYQRALERGLNASWRIRSGGLNQTYTDRLEVNSTLWPIVRHTPGNEFYTRIRGIAFGCVPSSRTETTRIASASSGWSRRAILLFHGSLAADVGKRISRAPGDEYPLSALRKSPVHTDSIA